MKTVSVLCAQIASLTACTLPCLALVRLTGICSALCSHCSVMLRLLAMSLDTAHWSPMTHRHTHTVMVDDCHEPVLQMHCKVYQASKEGVICFFYY